MKNTPRLLKRIGTRRWRDVFDFWQECIPLVTFPVQDFSEPAEDVALRLREIGEEVSRVETTSTNRLHFAEIPGLKYKAFTEAISLFYKSQNAMKSAQGDLQCGLKTWSIVNYYQAAYYSIKCLLNLLGVHLCRTSDNKDLVVDMLSIQPGAKKQLDTADCQIHIAWQLEHWELWALLQRMVRVTTGLPLGQFLINSLTGFDCKVFAKQRNLIVYHDGKWIFEDLRTEMDCTGTFSDPFEQSEDEIAFCDHESFTAVLASLVAIATFQVFSKIAENNPRFQIEFAYMKDTYSSKNNTILREFENAHKFLFV